MIEFIYKQFIFIKQMYFNIYMLSKYVSLKCYLSLHIDLSLLLFLLLSASMKLQHYVKRVSTFEAKTFWKYENEKIILQYQ